MTNRLGKEIKIYRTDKIDFSLKYKWTQAAVVPREDYFSHYLCPFKDIPTEPGLYIFIFPDASFYIGQSKNLEQRFKEHFYAFYGKKCNDWHKTFGIKNYGAAKHFIKDECFYKYMLVDEDKLDLYEHSALAQILKNGMADKYYNTIFYKGVDE